MHPKCVRKCESGPQHLGEPSWIPRFYQDWSAQVRVWTAEANSFWDRQKPQADPVLGSRHLGTFPARGQVSSPPWRTLPEYLGKPFGFPDPSETSLHR